jgi:hypothetical protein
MTRARSRCGRVLDDEPTAATWHAIAAGCQHLTAGACAGCCQRPLSQVFGEKQPPPTWRLMRREMMAS